jgi:putative tricarboxylic transport membrane protein
VTCRGVNPSCRNGSAARRISSADSCLSELRFLPCGPPAICKACTGFSFGAGTAPRIFATLLLGLGAVVMIVGIVTEGPGVAHYSWRGPLFVSLGIVFFAMAIRPLGLVISGLASFLISALGSHETRWVEAIIVGVCLTIGCALLFPYVLGLPMPLFPRFIVQ